MRTYETQVLLHNDIFVMPLSRTWFKPYIIIGVQYCVVFSIIMAEQPITDSKCLVSYDQTNSSVRRWVLVYNNY